jgi:hypothetical protein
MTDGKKKFKRRTPEAQWRASSRAGKSGKGNLITPVKSGRGALSKTNPTGRVMKWRGCRWRTDSANGARSCAGRQIRYTGDFIEYLYAHGFDRLPLATPHNVTIRTGWRVDCHFIGQPKAIKVSKATLDHDTTGHKAAGMTVVSNESGDSSPSGMNRAHRLRKVVAQAVDALFFSTTHRRGRRRPASSTVCRSVPAAQRCAPDHRREGVRAPFITANTWRVISYDHADAGGGLSLAQNALASPRSWMTSAGARSGLSVFAAATSGGDVILMNCSEIWRIETRRFA